MAKEYIQGGKEMTETTWAFNMDTACVESRRADGSVIAIDTLAVEREFVETWLDRRELDYLICSDPAACAEMAPCGDVEKYPDTGKKGQSTTEGRDIRSRPFLAENSLPEARIFELYDTPFSTVSTPSFTR